MSEGPSPARTARIAAMSAEFFKSVPLITPPPARLNLHREIATHRLPMSDALLADLRSHGIDRRALIGADAAGQTRLAGGVFAMAPIVAAKVVFQRGGRFEWFSLAHAPKSEAVGALIGLCHDVRGEACDVFAWGPNTLRTATLLGVAGLADDREALRPRMSKHLRVHDDPIRWLAAGRTGALIVDERRAGHVLRDAGPLVCSGYVFARLLRDRVGIKEDKIFVEIDDEDDDGGAA